MEEPSNQRSPVLYLASRSPRRADLLNRWGQPHCLVEPGPEPDPGAGPVEVVALDLARAKACGARVAGLAPGRVLGADTLVVAPDGSLLGKPKDHKEARSFLEALSGRAHRVVSAVWVRSHACRAVDRGGVDTSWVTFRSLGEDEIEAYLAVGEWEGKAGGYALQGEARRFLLELIGEEETVIGLPRGLTHWALAAGRAS